MHTTPTSPMDNRIFSAMTIAMSATSGRKLRKSRFCTAVSISKEPLTPFMLNSGPTRSIVTAKLILRVANCLNPILVIREARTMPG
ncbi:hypothetical protein MBAV_005376 [Candidatus Magnetobacterium bavaricum]|uniref:Uncharacterized protein n=1 Tax=Candidatus Magnetobacterium bavaricum TaxID=29290 RepID=A0A0F3GKF3_9BACT|nr:hypothetical protein MBAV_005376 [Candidatus Magnetobacterium bavaricum]